MNVGVWWELEITQSVIRYYTNFVLRDNDIGVESLGSIYTESFRADLIFLRIGPT